LRKTKFMDEQYGQLIEPSSVPFSFGAPGWYVLGAFMLLVTVGIGWLIFLQYKRNLYRRQALKMISAAESGFRDSGAAAPLLYDTNMLLKRVAMSRYGREHAASVKGLDWINFLNQSCSKALFDENDNRLLEEQLYAPDKEPNINASVKNFLDKSKKWIRDHHRVKEWEKPDLHHQP